MNLRTFQKFDPWETHRFIWEKKPGEAPLPAPAGTPPAAPRTPEQEAAARARQAAEAETRAKAARQQHDPEAVAAAEAALAALGIKIKTAPQEGQQPVTIEQLETVLKKANAEQILALDASLNALVTNEEKTAFREKHKNSSGSLDLALIGKNIAEGKLNIRELLIFSQIIEETPDLLSKQDEAARKALEAASQQCKALKGALEKQVKPKFSAEQIDNVFNKEAYQKAYEKFLADSKKDEFLAAITDENDKAVIEWAITAEPTLKEKTAVAAKFKDLIAKNDPKAIAGAVASQPPQMNFREGMIARAILADLQTAADESAIPDSVKGLGFMAILEKLIDQLSKLAEKISSALEKAFKKQDEPSEKPRFAKSPLGEDKKFKLKRQYEEGKGVAFEAAKDTEIFSVEKGEVTVSDNTVTIKTEGGGRIEYRNVVTEADINGTTIEAGKRIGKAGEQGFVELRAFNNENKEGNPTALLEPYLTTEETVAQTSATENAPAQPAPVPPGAVAPSPATTSPPAPAPKATATPAPAPAPPSTT